MKSIFLRKRSPAFTLIELLTVITIIAILATLITPVVRVAIIKARMAETMNNGKSIYLALTTAETDKGNILPNSSKFANSTDYWKWVVSNNILNVSFDFFAAYGMNPCYGLDQDKFTEENNAWCIIANAGPSTHNMAPLLFTRNLEINTLGDALDDALTDNVPFGNRGVIVVNRAGGAKIMKQSELEKMFNQPKANNPVLRP